MPADGSKPPTRGAPPRCSKGHGLVQVMELGATPRLQLLYINALCRAFCPQPRRVINDPQSGHAPERLHLVRSENGHKR